eukprot:3849078-Prymnesium_polylepis.1
MAAAPSSAYSADTPSTVYQYSEPHKQAAGLVRFSPNGKYVACAVAYRLLIRDTDTLQIVQV